MSIINWPILYLADPLKGRPLFNAKIFVGIEDLDPEIPANQKQLSVVQEDGTVVGVPQPFVVGAGGIPLYNGSPVRLDVDGNFSIKILDKNDSQTYYIENIFDGQPVFVEDLPNLTDTIIYPIVETNIINDLSQAYIFATVAEYKASLVEFPDGKTIHLADRGADFIKVSGTGTANTFNVIASDVVPQSIELIITDEANVKQFGALGDSSTDDRAAIQSAIDYIEANQDLSGDFTFTLPLVFPAATYLIKGGLNISSLVMNITGLGYAKIQANDSLVTTFSIFNITVTSHLNIENLIFGMFGMDITGISGRTWRQSLIHDCQFSGGNGIDLETIDNNWGTTISKCRFNSVETGISASIGGQTFQIRDCLFFNSSIHDLAVRSQSIGSQLLVDGCVFEAGDSIWVGKSIILTDVKEANLTGCQSERLGGITGQLDTKDSYDMQFTNSAVKMSGCRFWGGIWNGLIGDASSSREFGLYLDNSSLKLDNSRLYSFTKVALRSNNGSTIHSDIVSQVDFRSNGGIPIYHCDSDLGENWVTNGDFRFTYDNSIPLSFDRFNSTGQSPMTPTIEPCNNQRLNMLSANAPSYTNWVDVHEDEWISWRFIIETGGFVNYRIRNEAGDAIFEAIGLTVSGGQSNNALVCNSVQIPAGTTRVRIELPNNSIIEGCALYRNIKLNITAAGSLYSTNDSSNNCLVDLAPPLPFKPSSLQLKSIQQASSVFTGQFKNGDVVMWDSPPSSADVGEFFNGAVWSTINWS